MEMASSQGPLDLLKIMFKMICNYFITFVLERLILQLSKKCQSVSNYCEDTFLYMTKNLITKLILA